MSPRIFVIRCQNLHVKSITGLNLQVHFIETMMDSINDRQK